MGLVPLKEDEGKETSLSMNVHHIEERTAKSSHLQAREKGLSPRTPGCWYTDLDFPAFRIVRNKCILFKPPSLGNLYGSPNETTLSKIGFNLSIFSYKLAISFFLNNIKNMFKIF